MPQASANLARARGSRTAEIVAVSRARHLLRHARPYVFEDTFAIHFVGDRWRRVLRSYVLDLLFSKVLLGKLMPITTQHLTRARFAEECLEEAVRRGVTQYVILGSGFDTFAFRRPGLGLTVFEVDLAATIDLKRERLAAADMTPPDALRFVPIDFERDDLGTELAAAGLDPAGSTFFNWMGVTYYLTESAILDNLARLAGIGGPGAEVVLDYLVAAECVPPEDRGLFAAMTAFVEKRGRAHDLALRSGRSRDRPRPSRPLGGGPQRIAGGAPPAVPGRANRRSSSRPHHLVASSAQESRRRIAVAAGRLSPSRLVQCRLSMPTVEQDDWRGYASDRRRHARRPFLARACRAPPARPSQPRPFTQEAPSGSLAHL